MRKISFKAKITLTFLATYTILSLYLIGLFYVKAVLVQKENLRQKLMELSTLGTRIVPASLVEKIVPTRSNMNSAEYLELRSKLQSIMNVHPDIADVYVLVNTRSPGIMKFVANADEEELVDCGEQFDVTRYPQLVKAVHGPSADHRVLSDRWGDWLSGYAPIRDKADDAIAILGIDISAETIAQMRRTVLVNAVYVFLVGVVISILAGNLASWWLTKPIKALMKGMDQICSGNLDYAIPVRSSDEIGKLAGNFNKMARELKKYIQDLTEVTSEKERLNRELEIAAELQKAMLPHYNLDIEEIDLAGLSLPAREVGGDYFDYMDNDGRNIGFVIADATGKGLYSSIFMTNSRSIFKIMTTEETSPGKVIERTNDLVIREMGSSSSSMFITMFYGIYDKDTSVFRYSNAGHNPPLFIESESSRIELLKPHGYPIGIMEEQKYADSQVHMEKGDLMVLYTDGVVEAMNSKKEMYGLSRLSQVVLESRHLPAQELVNNIRESVFKFTADLAQFDDLTLLVFRVK
ncbi:MAG: SpoIIE family protein phosphatase [Candidatus Omnitrophica bacterium]|nr:SpoIIE family protein phosphatase [Candidatus Omnitrophota bacterium]